MKTSSSLPVFTSTSTETVAVPGQIRSYAELQQQIHDTLRVQHPEWIEPDGNCPTCESYERRLAQLIGFFQSGEHNLVAA
jgi:hypothetical protein